VFAVQPKMSKVRLMLLTALMLLSVSLMGCGGGSKSSGAPGPVITASYLPAKGATNVCVDTPLKLTFDSAPTVGKAGLIKVFKADGTLVDSIKLEDSTMSIDGSTTYGSLTTRVNALGWGSGQVRFVNYYPVLVNGKTATIYLHNQKLAYNTKYYVTIDAAVLTGKINGTSFSGISDAATWTFTTKATAPSGTTLTVDDDAVSNGAKADFCTVQGALDNIPKKNTSFYTVDVASGIYEEMLFMYDKDNVTIQGAGRDSTVIEYYNYDGFNSGNGDSVYGLTNPSDVPAGQTLWQCGHCVAFFKESTGIVLKNLTIRNTTPNSDGKRAEALALKGDSHTFVAKSCKFLGYQDTILLNGINWLYDCYISGDVDFIWGSPKVSLLEKCEIYCTGDSGYIVNARCASGEGDLGFVFLNCNITGNNTGEYLARHGDSNKFDNVSYLNCKMGNNINTSGWSGTPNPATATSKSGWREYNNKAADGTTNWKSTTAAKPDGAAHYLSQSEYLSVFGGSPTATTVDHTTILGKYSFSPTL
jgi:pectin methylesterase-like acyl-CoA thioesterase